MIPALLFTAFANAAAPDAPTGGATDAVTGLSGPALGSTDPSSLVGPPAGPPLTGKALQDATHAIAEQLRCPVCQGLSVWDSPSESAVAIKDEVGRLAGLGFSEQQCLTYFEASYGEFILLKPKAEGLNLLVWAAPGGLVVAGLALVAWMRLGNRTRGAPSAAAGLPAIDPALQPYVNRVYEIVGRGNR